VDHAGDVVTLLSFRQRVVRVIKRLEFFYAGVLKLFSTLPKSFAVEAVWLENGRCRWAAHLVPMLLQGECGYENL